MKYLISDLKIIIENLITKKLRYLVLTGKDYNMMLEIIRLVQSALKAYIIKIDYNEGNLSQIKSQLMTNNLLGDIQLIIIDNITKFADLKNLLAIEFLHLPIFIFKTLDKKEYRYFDNIEDAGLIVCDYSDEFITKNIISKIFNKANKVIDSKTLSYLVECLTHSDYQYIVNEIQKLLNYIGDDSEIDLIKAQALINPKADDADRNELCLHYAKNNIKEFLKQIDILNLNGFNNVALIRSLIEYYINIYYVLNNIKTGNSLKIALSQAPVYFRFQTNISTIISNHTLTKVAQILQILQKAEIACKLDYQSFDVYQYLAAPRRVLDDIS